MNYRHIYHAGNFADVFKHIIVTRIVDYLKRKPQAFRVIDTHAGSGLYDLEREEAQKTGEWRHGVARFFNQPFDEKNRSLLAPWLETLQHFNPDGALRSYPGSPMLVRHLLRKQDRLTAIELHETDYETLRQMFAGDYQARILHLDGWLALGAHVPPKEKRGLVLVDPPFEENGEFERLVSGLEKAVRRFAGGVYALWYAIKDYQAVERFVRQLRASGITRILRLELRVRAPSPTPRLDGSGMIIINPPYTLAQEMAALAPVLLQQLGEDKGANLVNDWIRSEEKTL
ncbi:MAG: Ribosomal RNA large subunit methyltransferase J [Candidatus Tokpelaia hoelldobleri]|uniref:Ribosomal RNA large subunit methyltransferase J n=1 Tax=Candidatus Tokpelaia hoelldobleri TaxID=1902579 RepID=A0A1U9JU53_9HYPH|nr:MAG: Ribosomal RNA large subunit methyltransferase J [Candidatus Tokpelaia hoelldoblerii]